MKMQTSPTFFFLFNPGESLPLLRLVLFLPHVPPTSCAGITSWFNVLPSHHHTLYLRFFRHFSSRSISYSSLNRLVFSLLPLTPPPLLFPIESGFDCTMEKKICHFIFQYNQERMCPAPVCPFGGNIAMLQRFNCANRVGGSQRQCRTWICAIIKLQWFIYFSFRSTKSLFFGLLLTIFISETCFLEP